MERTATWSTLGTNVAHLTTVQDVLREAKLDYTVEKVPLFLPNGQKVPDKCATVTQGNDSRYIGTVSNSFTILQNEDAFDFVNNISDEFKFVKAGETNKGMVYIIGELPPIDVLGDVITPNVIVQNGHNGLYGMRSTIVPLRIVCQNQFNISFKESPNTLTFKHFASITSKVEEAQKLLSGVAQYMKEFKSNACELANLKVGRDGAIQIIDSYFEKMKEQKSTESAIERINDQRDYFVSCYNAEDNQNFQGTAWGLVNAFTDFTTHKPAIRTVNEERKFMKVTFDPTEMSLFMAHMRSQIAA